MSEQICRYNVPQESTAEPNKKITPGKRSFKNVRIWFVVLSVYLIIFGYIGYIAFWPMAFNDPKQTVGKYFEIVDEYGREFKDVESVNYFESTIAELVKKAEAEADDMQQLASQSFNIVLGAFLAFLSATVTTIFQGGRD